MARGATVRGNIRIEVEEYDTGAGASASNSRLTSVFERVLDYISGTTDGTSVDRVHTVAVSFGTGTSPIDLAGTLTSQIAGGAVTTFVDLQLMIIENTGTSGDLRVGGVAASAPFISATTEYIPVLPGGFIMFHFGNAGLPITATTADLVKVVSSTGTVTGKAYFIGRSA